MTAKTGLLIRHTLFLITAAIRIVMFYKNHIKPKAFLFVTKKGEDNCKDTKLNHKVYKIKTQVTGDIPISATFLMVCLNAQTMESSTSLNC